MAAPQPEAIGIKHNTISRSAMTHVDLRIPDIGIMPDWRHIDIFINDDGFANTPAHTLHNYNYAGGLIARTRTTEFNSGVNSIKYKINYQRSTATSDEISEPLIINVVEENWDDTVTQVSLFMTQYAADSDGNVMGEVYASYVYAENGAVASNHPLQIAIKIQTDRQRYRIDPLFGPGLVYIGQDKLLRDIFQVNTTSLGIIKFRILIPAVDGFDVAILVNGVPPVIYVVTVQG